MNPRQREYFRQKLERWKEEILRESRETLENLQEESQNHPDMADRASSESDRALELRTRDRQRKLISKIDAALKRIVDGVETNYISATLALFLDAYIVFHSLLILVGIGGGDRE